MKLDRISKFIFTWLIDIPESTGKVGVGKVLVTAFDTVRDAGIFCSLGIFKGPQACKPISIGNLGLGVVFGMPNIDDDISGVEEGLGWAGDTVRDEGRLGMFKFFMKASVGRFSTSLVDFICLVCCSFFLSASFSCSVLPPK